jgi:DegV family protein with EDD domain
MSEYVLSCCSTADLTEEQFKNDDIHYVCFHYYLNGVPYADDLGKSISFPEFYQAMVSGADTRTSQVNSDEYAEYFEQFLKQGLDIFHVTLSSGISGSINSAQIARDELAEKYPDRKIIVEDSLAASAGYGLLMDKLAELKKSGYSMEELQKWLVEHRLKLNHWFFSSDLTFYIKGGRVSKVSGFVGSVLNICPLLNVNFEGKLIPRYKIRSKKKAVEAIVKKMVELAEGRENYSGKCFISQSACFDDAKAVADLVEKNFPKLDGRVVINDIGTTIGSHTGPGTVALFFWGDERTD